MTDILKKIIKHYSLWWQSNADYALSSKTGRFAFSTLAKRICNGILLSLVILPAACLMLKPMYGNSVGYAAVMMAISGCTLGDRIFFAIIKRAVKHPSEFCYKHPVLTTALYYFISHCLLVTLVIYIITFNYTIEIIKNIG
ncbi:hypothetical protein FKH18_25875 [Salmonella enterica]|uniref:Uncharacterized protein n=1 Tax=Salmonella enterica subsp. enterica serovar Java TaxID=224729 RepID=A0A5U8K2A6_SALEB|nr:hypothetical protein [Salmonella enterica]EBR8572829.1 hypothetical protein [Salmonella enterica subsp. enterica serovar Java]EBW7311022.1 hypothetical protein [Salmonella enterica subsp. enterica serovar Enteritidis]EBW9699357.1 hypothetical protein [Salmonella enterica subsp. enterica serovar Oranienburg]EKN5803889.1 hypothetical protein [Salmonella enterica subsp. enterica]